MNAVSRPAIIGATAVAVSSGARWVKGNGSLDTTQMFTIAAAGAGAAFVAPAIASAAYVGAGRGLVEALVSGVIAAGALYLMSGDASVAMHVPIQALAHIGGSVISTSVAPQPMPMSGPATADQVGDLAASM